MKLNDYLQGCRTIRHHDAAVAQLQATSFICNICTRRQIPQTVPTAPPWHSSYPSNAPYESKVAKPRRKMNRAGPNLVKTLRLCLLPFLVMICSKMAHGLARSSIYEKLLFQFAARAAVPTVLSATRCTCCEIISIKKEKAYDGYGKSSSRS